MGDNYFAALNSAVFSDGSFVFVPKVGARGDAEGDERGGRQQREGLCGAGRARVRVEGEGQRGAQRSSALGVGDGQLSQKYGQCPALALRWSGLRARTRVSEYLGRTAADGGVGVRTPCHVRGVNNQARRRTASSWNTVRAPHRGIVPRPRRAHRSAVAWEGWRRGSYRVGSVAPVPPHMSGSWQGRPPTETCLIPVSPAWVMLSSAPPTILSPPPYNPQGVKCPMELSTYFRINASETGQVGTQRAGGLMACVGWAACPQQVGAAGWPGRVHRGLAGVLGKPEPG